jgi:phage/plasmid-like protein (TIGR03299 family)
MSANVETMFYAGRAVPWHGLGVQVDHALSSEEALEKAGLNWRVEQSTVVTNSGIPIEGYKANVRDSDGKVLGVVTDRYRIVQNHEAFAFTDDLLGKGVRYETAGSLQEGKKVWLLAKLPAAYIFSGGDRLSPYLVFSNSHDGSGAIKIAMTPIRVVCNNTLNLALNTADRIWTANHTGNIGLKLEDAKETLFRAEDYMDKLGKEISRLNKVDITDELITEMIRELLPIPNDSTELQEKNVMKLRDDVSLRFYYAPDLQALPKNAYRFVNAVSDFATHGKPLRETASYRENLFARTIEGNALIDKSYQLVRQIA